MLYSYLVSFPYYVVPVLILPYDLEANIIPSRTRWLKLSGKSPMDLRTPPLNIKILPESNPPKSRIVLQ